MNTERKTRIVHNNLPRGVLLWRTSNGGFLGDSDGNYLSMECLKGDLLAVKKMREAAAYYGYPEGETVFFPGRGQCTQGEWEDSMAALLAGEELPFDVPDEAFEEGG